MACPMMYSPRVPYCTGAWFSLLERMAAAAYPLALVMRNMPVHRGLAREDSAASWTRRL